MLLDLIFDTVSLFSSKMLFYSENVFIWFCQKFVRIGFHAVGGWSRWIVKWRLDGDEMETMRGTDRSIGPAEHQASDVYFLKNSIWIVILLLLQYTMFLK